MFRISFRLKFDAQHYFLDVRFLSVSPILITGTRWYTAALRLCPRDADGKGTSKGGVPRTVLERITVLGHPKG